MQALDLRPRGTPIEVWQFDDAALVLFGRGVRLRLRVAADGRSEFTLKVADQECARIDAKLIPPGEGKCEYDVYGTSAAGAISLTRSLDAKSTHDLVAGRMAPAQALERVADQIFARNRRNLAAATWTASARSDASPDLPHQG